VDVKAKGAHQAIVLLVEAAGKSVVCSVAEWIVFADIPVGFRSVSRQWIAVARIRLRHGGSFAVA